MKIFFSFFAGILFQFSIAQITSGSSDTVFFNIESVKCPKEKAVFYRITTKQNDSYQVTDFNSSTGILQMTATCKSIDPLIKNGDVIYYYESGKRKSKGSYVNNMKLGVWKIWDENGTDSTVVECFKDGTYKNISISKNFVTPNTEYDLSYPISTNAEFPGGERKMQVFLAENIQFPEAEMQAGINGKCYVAFTIEKDGTLNKMELLDRGILNTIGYNNEALRVAHLMTNWKPATEFGQPVPTRFYLPVIFNVKHQ